MEAEGRVEQLQDELKEIQAQIKESRANATKERQIREEIAALKIQDQIRAKDRAVDKVKVKEEEIRHLKMKLHEYAEEKADILQLLDTS